MGLDLRPSSHFSCVYIVFPILCLFGNERTSLALRASASLAAPYSSDSRNIFCLCDSITHILLSFPSPPVVLSGHLQAFSLAISVYGCGYRSTRVLAVFTVLRNPKGLPSMLVSTSFRGLYSSCSHTACYFRSSNGCTSSSTPDQGLPYNSS